jgi:hypothetical protein
MDRSIPISVSFAPIIVVSGLPRSGTSLMMRMLVAGGVPVITDGRRIADEDNPTGYFEFEPVKTLESGDQAWLTHAAGKAVKVVSPLLEHLPPEHVYRVLFMHRRMGEILASQRRMLERRGEPAGALDDARMAALFGKHLDRVHGWLARQPNIEALDVDYNQLLANPGSLVQQIHAFLGNDRLDTLAMIAAIDPTLYRHRESPTAKESF